jgi:3-oxoacid CoA-transferase
MANAARCTIVECEELVETGELKPEQIHLPGLNVNRIFKGEKFENRIEVLKFSDEKKSDLECGPETSVRDVIAQRAALACPRSLPRMPTASVATYSCRARTE